MKKIVSILYFVLGFIFTGFVGKYYPRDFIAGINDLCVKHGFNQAEIWIVVGAILILTWPIWLIYLLICMVIS